MIDYAHLSQFVGGLGLFVFAMSLLERALRQRSQASIRRFVQLHADRPWKSVAVGTLATAVVQSSSLVGLIVLALVGASVMPLPSALGVIFGANLGTTITGWLVATIGFKLDLSVLAYWLVGAGALAGVTLGRSARDAAAMVSAIGLLLIGLSLMKDSVSLLSARFDLATFASFALWQFLLFGVIAAAILQSSSATISIVLAALSAEIVDINAAVAVVVGADLGTTTTVLLGAAFGPSTRKQAAAAHFIFNLTTTVVAFVLLLPLLSVVRALGVQDPLYTLVAFHSLFNLLGIVLFLPVLKPLARLLQRRYPEQHQRQARFIGPTVVDVTEVAVAAVNREVGYLIARVLRQIGVAFQTPPPGSLRQLDPDALSETWANELTFPVMYRQNKHLEGEIVAFSLQVQREPVDPEQSARLQQLLSAARHAIGAAKATADIHHDLEALRFAANPSFSNYFKRFADAYTNASGALATTLEDASTPLAVRDFLERHREVSDLHETLNQAVYADVKAGTLDDDEISTLLNVNRELLQANVAILAALQDYLLESTEAATLTESYSATA